MSDPLVQGLEVYIVGGAVRDALLNKTAGDHDWVVVGTDPATMEKRGFIPVGGDFPVFLHPITKEEYALARTERKSGRGYRGFTFYTGPDVTLEDDLGRRDLTINAIAQAPDGRLIDPLCGQADIRSRVLRHVGQAFTEDPVRMLRLARFAARFHDFSIADETMTLARELVENGEVDALVPERVWQEVAKGLMTDQPGRMFQVLIDTGALPRVLPGLIIAPDTAAELACAARHDLSLACRFALLCRNSPDPHLIGLHIRAPSDCQDYARLLPDVLAGLGATSAEATLDVLMRCDVLRRPQRFQDLLSAAACVVPVDHAAWQERVSAIRSIDAAAIASQYPGQPERIKQALRAARIDALSQPGQSSESIASVAAGKTQ